MFIEKYEVIKEFRFVMDELDYPVKARVVKILDESYPQQFSWDISHFYKPFEEAASVYTPSNTFGITALEAERKLMTYVDAFTTFDILENERY